MNGIEIFQLSMSSCWTVAPNRPGAQGPVHTAHLSRDAQSASSILQYLLHTVMIDRFILTIDSKIARLTLATHGSLAGRSRHTSRANAAACSACGGFERLHLAISALRLFGGASFDLAGLCILYLSVPSRKPRHRTYSTQNHAK